MGEHLHLQQFPFRATDILVGDGFRDVRHLLQRQLAGGHHHVGELRVEAHGLDVGDIALGGDMHLDANAVGVCDDCHVRGDDGRDARRFGGLHQPAHLLHLVVVYDGVHRQIGAHAVPVGDVCDARQVVKGEIGRRARPHIEVAHTEIDGIGTCLDGRLQTFIRPHRGHHLYLLHNL